MRALSMPVNMTEERPYWISLLSCFAMRAFFSRRMVCSRATLVDIRTAVAL